MLRVILLLILAVVFLGQLVHAASEMQQCLATKEYLEQVRRAEHINQSLDYTCFVDIDEVKISDYLVIDARESRNNKNVLIPSSIRMSAKQIVAHDFLKSKSLLLVAEGDNVTQMANLCSQLVKNGFSKAKIINNGVWAWFLEDNLLSGKEGDINQLNYLSVSQVFRVMHNDGFYLFVSDKYKQYLTELINNNQALTDVLNNKIIYFPNNTKKLSIFISRQIKQVPAAEIYPTYVLSVDEMLRTNLNEQLKLGNLFILNASIQELMVEYINSKRTALRYKAVPNRFQCK